MVDLMIRKAKRSDSDGIAYYIALAMWDILFLFIGEESEEKALRLLKKLVSKEGNQYSYQNCWVVELDNEIVAAVCIYNGADLIQLRQPVAREIRYMFGRDFNPEDETQAGEYYIDSISVDPRHQGKGIGGRLFRFLIDEYVFKQNQTIGLLVDKDNPEAKRLYLKMGFTPVEDKTLAGKPMEHLQYRP